MEFTCTYKYVVEVLGNIIRQGLLKIEDLNMVNNLDFVSKLIQISCVSQIKFCFQTYCVDLLGTLIPSMLQRNKPQNKNTMVKLFFRCDEVR
jgi:hypothetical protein